MGECMCVYMHNTYYYNVLIEFDVKFVAIELQIKKQIKYYYLLILRNIIVERMEFSMSGTRSLSIGGSRNKGKTQIYERDLEDLGTTLESLIGLSRSPAEDPSVKAPKKHCMPSNVPFN
jgi:hypothetical protein